MGLLKWFWDSHNCGRIQGMLLIIGSVETCLGFQAGPGLHRGYSMPRQVGVHATSAIRTGLHPRDSLAKPKQGWIVVLPTQVWPIQAEPFWRGLSFIQDSNFEGLGA